MNRRRYLYPKYEHHIVLQTPRAYKTLCAGVGTDPIVKYRYPLVINAFRTSVFSHWDGETPVFKRSIFTLAEFNTIEEDGNYVIDAYERFVVIRREPFDQQNYNEIRMYANFSSIGYGIALKEGDLVMSFELYVQNGPGQVDRIVYDWWYFEFGNCYNYMEEYGGWLKFDIHARFELPGFNIPIEPEGEEYGLDEKVIKDVLYLPKELFTILTNRPK